MIAKPLGIVNVPAVAPEPKLNTGFVPVLQTFETLNPIVAIGCGFTVIVKFCVEPTHVFAVGVTLKFPTLALEPVFVAVNRT